MCGLVSLGESNTVDFHSSIPESSLRQAFPPTSFTDTGAFTHGQTDMSAQEEVGLDAFQRYGRQIRQAAILSFDQKEFFQKSA